MIGDFFKIFCLACQSIDDPEASHRFVSYSISSVNGRYRVGTEATYTCSSTYGLPYDGGKRTCQWDGFWEGHAYC